ncbi:(2Fe-2S)-binding protein [Alteromonadaceae bacterium BrNp21-10]|nr:(2Fe-2S)-binding protein [Alteromonadaceae bacterium BrNp21-10]
MQLSINDNIIHTELEADTPLLWLLRDELGLNSTKFGCGMGLCGACTVHLNGQPVRSCSLTIAAIGNNKITTIEGENSAQIQCLKAVWMQQNIPQCGYCQVGQLMSASALLKQNNNPDEATINAAMSGNICRCGTYVRIKAGIIAAAKQIRVIEV